MKKSLAVCVLVDEAMLPLDGDTTQEYREEQSTEFQVVKALRELGHTVSVTGIWNEIEPVIQKIRQEKPDVVFNLTEQFNNNRWHDKNIAGLLELLDFPFTGAGSTGLMLSRNKAVCKQILSTRKIRVPGFFTVNPGMKARVSRNFHFPLVVKPLYEDGSDGIANASLVKNSEELRSRTRWVHETFQQPVIAEEYVCGRELYVTVLGDNSHLQVLPFREIVFSTTDGNGPVLATSRVKWNKNYQKKWNIEFTFAEGIGESIAERIIKTCRKTFSLLHLSDYGRIDCRLTDDNTIVILEANANPDLQYFEEVAQSARKAGISYQELISTILYSAIRRHARLPQSA